MLDKHVVPLLKPPLKRVAEQANHFGIKADQLTVTGFLVGLLSVLLVAIEQPLLGLAALMFNRLADGLDGELARLSTPTDAGGFLDITLDFVFYALFPLGFALMDPAENALPAACLIASFVGTGASFLAFSTVAEKRQLTRPQFAYKGLYYLDGLAEGTETIICFALMCLFPQWFSLFAWVFAALCAVTTINRVASGYQSLR